MGKSSPPGINYSRNSIQSPAYEMIPVNPPADSPPFPCQRMGKQPIRSSYKRPPTLCPSVVCWQENQPPSPDFEVGVNTDHYLVTGRVL